MKYLLIFLLPFSLYAGEREDDIARLSAIGDYIPFVLQDYITAHSPIFDGMDEGGVRRYIYETASTESLLADLESRTTVSETEVTAAQETAQSTSEITAKHFTIPQSGTNMTVTGAKPSSASIRHVKITGVVYRKTSTATTGARVEIDMVNYDGAWSFDVLFIGDNTKSPQVTFYLFGDQLKMDATALAGTYNSTDSYFKFRTETIAR